MYVLWKDYIPLFEQAFSIEMYNLGVSPKNKSN